MPAGPATPYQPLTSNGPVTPDSCTVEEGRTVTEADCVCKTSKDFFLKIWNDGYRPGMKDFFSGTIKSNNPNALRSFLISFGKEA